MSSPLMNPPKPISLSHVLKQGWGLVDGFKLPVFLLAQLLMGILITVGTILSLFIFFFVFFDAFFGHYSTWEEFFHAFFGHFSIMEERSINAFFFVYWSITCFIYFFINVLLTMIGIRKAIHIESTVSIAFHACKNVFGKLVLFFLGYCGIIFIFCEIPLLSPLIFGSSRSPHMHAPLSYIVFLLLFMLFFIIHIIVMHFIIPLVILRKVSIIQAFSIGLQKIKPVFKVIAIFAVLFSLPSLPIIMFFSTTFFWTFFSFSPALIFANIWIQPFYFSVFGVLFKEIYGLAPLETPTAPKVLSADNP